MRNFRDLRAWQQAHRLTLRLYRETKSLPKDELFGLTSQMRRACLSIEANLAEGCGRQTDGELARFGQIALGSASELECHLLVAKDLEYLTSSAYRTLQEELEDVRRMLTGLRRSLNRSSDVPEGTLTGSRKAESGQRKAPSS
ncbi:MAG TPA: four helix bundle protein [Terriglobales bacterium]|nr:four helix bundle protein [Terriglobales bacterium]